MEGKNLCTQQLYLHVDPFYQPVSLPLHFASDRSGQSTIEATICRQTTCTTKQLALVQAPASLDHVRIHTPTSTIVEGGLLPFTIYGYDIYDNPVFRTANQFELTVV